VKSVCSLNVHASWWTVVADLYIRTPASVNNGWEGGSRAVINLRCHIRTTLIIYNSLFNYACNWFCDWGLVCRIWGSHSGGYEELSSGMSVETQPTFRSNMPLSKSNNSRNQRESRWEAECCVQPAFTLVSWLILRPWRRRRHVTTKHRLVFNGLHGVISQKTTLRVLI
jgi:hypothetical protein